jgi:hypothetical protein
MEKKTWIVLKNVKSGIKLEIYEEFDQFCKNKTVFAL